MHATHRSPASLCCLFVINSQVSSQAGSSGVHPDLIQLISDQTSASASRGSIIQSDFLGNLPHVVLHSTSTAKHTGPTFMIVAHTLTKKRTSINSLISQTDSDATLKIIFNIISSGYSDRWPSDHPPVHRVGHSSH